MARRAVVALYVLGALLTISVGMRYQLPRLVESDFRSIYLGASLGKDAYLPNIGNIKNLYFLYPPPGLLLSALFQPFSLLVALILAMAGSLILLARAARPFGPAWMALLTPAVAANLAFGQLGAFMSAMWLFAFSGSAIAGALLTIKPNFGALYLFEAIRRRQVVKVSAIVLAASALSTIVWGWEVWPAWLSNSAGFARSVKEHAFDFSFLNAGPLYPLGTAGWLAMAAVAAASLIKRFDLLTATLAAPVIAPYLLIYDLPAVCFIAAATLDRKWDRLSSIQRTMLAVTFLTPCYAIVSPIITPLVLLGTLALLCWFAQDVEKASEFAADDAGQALESPGSSRFLASPPNPAAR